MEIAKLVLKDAQWGSHTKVRQSCANVLLLCEAKKILSLGIETLSNVVGLIYL